MKKILLSMVLTLLMLFTWGFTTKAYNLINLKTASGGNVTYRGSSTVVQIPDKYELNGTEFRGAWVTPFVGDMSGYSSESAWKKEVASVLKVFDEYNLNAMIFHVRTHNNALYDSDLNPVATWFANANFDVFDPLAYLIDECHKAGIEFHAWMNPYRITTNTGDVDAASKYGQYLGESLPAVNIANNPDNLISGLSGSNGAVILNPGLPVVRDFIVDTCMEVIKKYDVDAIHFDDYFYIDGAEDSATYAKYGNGMTLANWRRKQVDLFIEQLHEEMTEYNKANNRAVQLGISPSGIYKNGNGSVESGSNTAGFAHYGDYLYSDTYKWAKEGWIDYLLPQSYWAFENKAAPYADVMDWWNKAFAGLDCLLYSGIGYYMADSSSNTYSWKTNMNELANQLTYLTKLTNVDGYSLYSFKYLRAAYNGGTANSAKQVENAVKAGCFNDVALVPEIENIEPINLSAVSEFVVDGNTLSWNRSIKAKAYVIYRSASPLTYSTSEIVDVIGGNTSTITWTDSVKGTYYYGVRPLSDTNTLGEKATVSIGGKATFTMETDTSTSSDLIGTEVKNNGGKVNDNSLQVGFTRCIFLSSDAPSATRQDYNFTSSDTNIATVSAYGTITGVSEGTATIRAEYKTDPNRWSEFKIYVYAEKGNLHTVTFKDNDGTILKTQKVFDGKDASAPILTDKQVGVNYYIFEGWDKDYLNVTSDLIVTAVYKVDVTKFTVTFVNYDGTVLKTQLVQRGNDATPPANPTKPSSEWYRYIFEGWDKSYENVQSNLTIKAEYTVEEKDLPYYTVTFVNHDGTVLSTQSIKQGRDATPPTDPTRSANMEYRYVFIGWDKSYTEIRADVEIKAVYEAVKQKYKVTFQDAEGNVLKEEVLEYGTSATAPDAPVKEGYEFTGWDVDFTNITKTTVVKATYQAIITIEEYTVIFKDSEGNILKEETVKAGESATAPTAPVKEGYEFTGWDQEYNNVTSDLEITALYQEVKANEEKGCKKDMALVIISLISLASVATLIWKKEK